MQCLTCSYSSGKKDSISSNSIEFIACPRCEKVFYCSTVCAEIGWHGHKSLCDARTDSEFLQRLRNKDKMERKTQLEHMLRHLAAVEHAGFSHEHIPYLLETFFSTVGFVDGIMNTDDFSLVNRVVNNIQKVLTGDVSSVHMTALVLLQSKIFLALLGEPDRALSTLRRGLLRLTLQRTEEEFEGLIELLKDELMNVWTHKYPNVIVTSGNLPVAARPIMRGEVVALDNVPLLAWRDNGFPSLVESSRDSAHVEGVCALRDAFLEKKRTEFTDWGLASGEEKVMASLLGELPNVKHIGAEAIVSATTCLTSLHNTLPPRWLVSLFFTAVLSRRRFRTKEWGLFDLVSRVRHSCAPNCIWDAETCELRALRTIVPQEPLTMDIFWRSCAGTTRPMLLKLPAYLRQEAVRVSVGFLCSCDRCVGRSVSSRYGSGVAAEVPQEKAGIDGRDSLRAFPCPLCRGKEGWRYRVQCDGEDPLQRCILPQEEVRLALQRRFMPSEPWLCCRCGEQWRDDEMPLETEKRLLRQAERLAAVASHGMIGKGFFEEAKGLMRDILYVVGRQRHSVYLLACEVFVLFYRFISRRFLPPTSLFAERYTVAWCRKWIKCAQNIQLPRDCPHVYASFISDTSLYLSSTAVFRDKIILLRHAETHCPNAVMFGEKSLEAATVAAILYDPSSRDYTTFGQSVSAFTTFMNAEEQDDEDTLISEWESHLMERVQSEIQSNEVPKLPPHIAKALGKM